MKFRIFKKNNAANNQANPADAKNENGIAKAFVNGVSGAGMFESIIKSQGPYRNLKVKPKSP